MARALTAFVLASALATVSWFRLEQRDVPLGAVLAVIGIALLPTLAMALGRRRAAVAGVLVLATIFAAGVAWQVSPLEARPGSGHDFFGPVLGAARNGLQDFYDATLPFDRVDYPSMHGLILFAVFGFAALVGMLAAAKRPVAAGLALLVGVGWPATLLPGDNPLFAGALALAGMLFILFLFRARGRTLRGLAPALVVGGLLVLAAVGASSTGAVAKGAFLRWQQWDLYDRPDKAVSVSYVWTSNYSGLRFPKKKTVVMRVQVDGPRRPLYWRATVLEDYNGGTWNETGDLSEPNPSREQIEVVDDPLLPGAGKRRANWVQQEITIQALRDNHLIASAQPVRWRPGTSSNYQTGPSGIVTLEQSLRQGQQYTAWSYAPKIRPTQLGDAGTAYPDELDPRYFEPLSGIQVPKLGAEGREQFMNALFATTNDSFLQAHRGLYQTAASLTRDSPTPYAAAAVLEAWFRNEDGGGFTYDQTPPQLPFGEPPLVAFLKDKRGYCQHYAGAMALMLRFVGVPARVAAGFTSGRWDPDQHEWTVTDHNAHTWVEVYFPGRGWLAFDPTPGRGNLDAEYSTTAASFNGPDGAIAPGFQARSRRHRRRVLREPHSGIIGGGTLRSRRNEIGATRPAPVAATRIRPEEESDSGGGAALLRLVGLLVGGGALLLVAAKTGRRQLRFASRDPRQIASACRSDLVGYLADQGVDAPPSLTLSELGELVESEFAVNSDPYVHGLSEARFGPPTESGPAIRRARRELRLLRRELGRQLSFGRRLRGTLSARSLTS